MTEHKLADTIALARRIAARPSDQSTTDELILANAMLASAPPAPSGWRSMESAPRDRAPIRALIHDDLYPRLKPGREDLEPWNGQEVILRHGGLGADGFDFGWNLAAPVGHGGFPDEWFVGWLPVGSAAPSPDTGKMGGEGAEAWDRQICTGCTSSMTVEDIKALGCVSCCPDRHMVSMSDLVKGYEASRRAPVSGGEGEAVAVGYVHRSVAEQAGAGFGQATIFEDSIPVLHDVAIYAHPSPAQSDTERMRAAAETLCAACEQEFTTDKTEGGSFTYGEPDEAEVAYPSSNITFGMIRELRAALGEA